MKEILKNNILSIICGVVVIIALVVPIWPMGGYRQDLESRLAERVSTYNSINALRTKTRNLPAVEEGAIPTPLDGFPNENIIAKGNEVKTAFESQSKELMEVAVKLNRKAPLVPNTLPIPANNAVAINFRDRYRSLIAPLLPNATPGAPPIIGGIAQQLKVGYPPTQMDIQTAVQNLWRTKYQPLLGGAAGNANATTAARAQLQEQYNAESAQIPDVLRNKVANENLLYMNLDALPYIPSFNNREAPQPLDIWNAQLHLWIIDDVGAAINEANAGAKSISDAPVKHLVKLSIPYPNPYVIMPGQTMDGELSGPAPKVTDLTAQGAQPGTTPMTTGRVCNPLYDVVQFDLVLNVEADKVNHVLTTLPKNRFLTVLTANVLAIDSFALKQQGYIYGRKPIVQLTLRCEDLFFHSWSRPLMPKAMSDLMTGVQPNMGMEGGAMPY